MNKIKPIFLVSLPRSGSTLLQKLLMSHVEISSHAETWIALPIIYSRKKNGFKAEYGQIQAYNAYQNVKISLQKNFVSDDDIIRKYLMSIYQELSNETTYFLDKTPRYYYILDELHRIFPEAKFIYLHRNPLSIYSSMVDAFYKGNKRCLDRLSNDLILGSNYIAKAYQKYSSKAISVKYESLIGNPNIILSDICKYLNLNYAQASFDNFSKIEIDGHGDKKGSKSYKYIVENNSKWKLYTNNWYLKKVGIYYLKQICTLYYSQSGFKKSQLLSDINDHKVSFSLSHLFFLFEFKIRLYLKKFFRYKLLR